jgi:hypothetical protein
VILQGGNPVKTTDKFVDDPVQIVVVPLKTAVGLAFTVTTALPVKEVPVQFTSLTAVNV